MSTNQDNRFAPLVSKFGDRIILETDKYPDYAKDASEITHVPSAIIFADSEQDTIDIIRVCHNNDIPIIFRGAGTGYTGGCVPSDGALILSLENLKNLNVDKDSAVAFCGPGVITVDLMKAAEREDLFYPPDPASYEESTLGGNIAENAGGLHCKKYGVTKDYVIGLKAVTVSGELIKTGIYNDKGKLFDITSILIGSEGLLAAVTEIAVRLVPLPYFGPTMLAAFDNPEDAAAVVAMIISRGVVPSVMEYMDADAVMASNAYEQSIEIDHAEAILLFETTGDNAIAEANTIESICRQFKAILFTREDDHDKADRLWRIRRNLSKAVKASAKHKIAEDVCVPPSRLPELVEYVAVLNRELPIRVNSYGHAGDGNLHVNFLTDSDDETIHELIDDQIVKLFRKTLELGGTLTGEHGIGLTKKNYLNLEFDDATIGSMKLIKSVFDNDYHFNPGKMFTD